MIPCSVISWMVNTNHRCGTWTLSSATPPPPPNYRVKEQNKKGDTNAHTNAESKLFYDHTDSAVLK